MYAWGDDTSTWKRPGGYDYGSARKGKLDSLRAKASAMGPRTYARSRTPDLDLTDAKKVIRSGSENPVVIATDVTGSMASWPGEIFDRLPLLYQTLSKYKEDLEVSLCAIGDATCDSYPIQVNDFASGTDLDTKLKALGAEGGGGGGARESYELFGYHMLNNTELPNAKSPFLLIFGDEGFYEKVNPAQVEHYIGTTLQAPVDSASVFDGLKKKFQVYLLHKEYYGNDQRIIDQWSSTIGAQNVIPVESSERAVDVALGLIAKKWGHFDDFKSNLSARHTAAESMTVYKSLINVKDPDPGMKSTVIGASKSIKSRPLA